MDKLFLSPEHVLQGGYFHSTLRKLQEPNTSIEPHNIMYPVFLLENDEAIQPVSSMPNVYRYGVNKLIPALAELVEKGLQSILIFGIIDTLPKDATGSNADSATNPVMRALPWLRKAFPTLLIACDVCLCPYTSHGHCGVLTSSGSIDHAESVKRIAQVALAYAKAGAHIVAPSDMMDNRIKAIKDSLVAHKLQNQVSVLSYSCKFASSLYGPFRDTMKSSPMAGDRKCYQLPPGSAHLAARAAIGTHDGVFHCDEVLACFMLKRLSEYKDAEIVRTRDMSVLKGLDIVVDVGAEFNHDTKRYDHHQREFKETLSSLRPELGDKYQIKLSSAGLVYAYYGERIIQELAPKEIPLTPEDLRLIYKKVYENFVEEMDAIDNGVPMTDTEPKYKIRTHLSARVGKLNPEWNSKLDVNMDEVFRKAMALVSTEFLDTVNYFISTWLPARDYVKSALENRHEVHESGEILEFTERFPWKEHLFDLENEMGMAGRVKFVLFNDKPNSWRVQSVPVSPTSFVTRKPLHKSWWGVRDELLSDVAGIKDCIFCHSTGFIGGNRSRDGALQMAVASLKAADE